MKILHVITGLAKAAGTSVFCGEVANELVAAGHEVTVAVCNPDAPGHYVLDPRVRLVAIQSILNPTPPLDLSTCSLVHIHALWSPVLHRVSVWAHAHSIPVVWSPHGMITPWAMRNKWLKKWLGWHLYQKRDLQGATLLHATAQSEVDDIRRLGLKNKVFVAPLGVRIQAPLSHSLIPPSNTTLIPKTVLFVSRVQKKKGLPMLLDAWARLSGAVKRDWHIRIVGPDQDNHTAELMAQCDRIGLTYSRVDNSSAHRPDVEFVGPRYGEDLVREYAAADLFVLPTHSENFGSVVIEALAQGVPVICTKGAPWSDLETYGCGLWVDVGVEALTGALAEMLQKSDDERKRMGENGRRLVEEKYLWSAVVKAMVAGYREVEAGLNFKLANPVRYVTG